MNYEPVFGFEPITRVGDRRALAIPRRPLRSDARGWVGADGLPHGAPPIVLSMESFEYDPEMHDKVWHRIGRKWHGRADEVRN